MTPRYAFKVIGIKCIFDYMSTMLRPAPSMAVSHFLRSLRPEPGAQIKASVLYKRFREINPNCDGCNSWSDVKLAELLSEHLKSKRVASGKVYLDYTIPYELDWAGPSPADVQPSRIVMTIEPSTRFPLTYLGEGISNLRVNVRDLEGDQPNNRLDSIYIRINGSTLHLYPNKEHTEFILPPGLWITCVLYSRAEICFESVASVGHRVEFQYDRCRVPVCYRFKSTVQYAGQEITYEAYVNGECSVSDNTAFMSIYKYDQIREGPPGDLPYIATTMCGLQGYSLDDLQDRAAVAQALQFLYRTGSDYVSLQPSDVPSFMYLKRESTGYRHCVQFQLARIGELVTGISLRNMLPDSLLNATVTVNGEVQSLSGELVLNTSLPDQFMIEYQSTFLSPMEPSRNIFEGASLVYRIYIVKGTLRDTLRDGKRTPVYTFPSIQEALRYAAFND